jgi:hypothetical protein
MIVLASQRISEMAHEISKNQTVKNVATSAGPSLVGTAVTVATANPIAGGVSSAAASALAKTHPDGFTEAAVALGLSVGVNLLSIVATPVILGLMAYEGAKHALGKKD